MQSPDSDSDLDFDVTSFVVPPKTQRKRRKVSTCPVEQRREQLASHRPAASKLKVVDNAKPSTSREIFDDENVGPTRPKNSKRKSIAKNELHKNLKVQRLAASHASRGPAHSENPANTGSKGTSSVKSSQLRGSDEGTIRTSSLNHEETYAASGLKQSLHGVVYQLKHLMLVLIRAREMGYRFRLATEMDAAEKFDDLVLQYQDNAGNKVHRFVQLKHRQDETQPITASDLLADMDGAFSVKKYFNSWRKIKQHSAFEESLLKDFILCTNIGLDIQGLNEANIGFDEVTEPDDFLKVKDRKKQPLRYKLKAGERTQLHDELKTASDIHQLAQVLAQRVRDSQKIDLRTDIFKRYHVALAQEVIDIEEGRFSDNFVMNNLSAVAKRFRDVLSTQLSSGQHISESDIRSRLKKCKLKLSERFGKIPQSVNESELKKLTELPNDDQTIAIEITDFLDKFILAVDQPNEVELGEIIKREMGDNSMFNVLDADLVGNSFQNDILNLFKEKSGIFLKEDKVQALFEEIEVKLSSIMTTSLNLEYLEMFKEYDIEFERENRDVLNFLCSSGSTRKPILQLVSSRQSLLTALQVHQTLKQMEKYNKTDSFIFMNLEKLLRPKTADIVSRAFQNPRNHNLLVIDCGSMSVKPEMHRLWNQLGDTIARNAEKRMMLIIQGNDDSVVQFQSCCEIFYEKDDSTSINNLRKCSRQKLLEKKVIKFQGQDTNTSFARLLNIRDFDDFGVDRSTKLSRIIDVDTLVRLIREEEILIGSAVKGLGEIEDYYIPRTIVCEGGTKDDILDEDEFTERNEQGRTVVISDAAGMGKSTVLTHLASKIKEKEPDMLVIRIDLTQNTHVLDKEQLKRSFDNDDTNGAVDFLVDKLSSITNDLESQVFKTIIKDQGNAALLFDGFDEISPTYADAVVNLFQALERLSIKKLLVTTRPYASDKLRELEVNERFPLAFYTLMPFSVADQKEFLYRYWKMSLGPNNSDEMTQERLENYTQDVIDLLARSINDHMNKFTGIPLQTKLVAENFQYPFELPEKIDILDLYKGFVKKKYDLYRKEKKCADSTKQAEITDLGVSYKIFLMTHQKFALDTLFDKERAKMLLSSQPRIEACLDLFKDVIEGEERTGIITEVIEGEPYFIHRTFAEYFAAEFLFNTLQDDSHNQQLREFFLKELFVASGYPTIRCFLNCILPDVRSAPKKEPWLIDLHGYRNCFQYTDTVFHIAAAERNVRIISFFVNRLGPTLLESHDITGRLPLHLAVEQKGNSDVVKYLFENTANINSLSAHKRIALHYAVGADADFEVIEYLLEKGANINFLAHDDRTVLHDAVRHGKGLDLVKYLVNKGANIHSLAKDGRTVLHDAVRLGADLDVVKYLLDNGANVNSVAKDGRTVLHDAVRQSANLDMVKYLVEQGANINSLTEDGETVLHDAVSGKAYLEVVKYLVEKGVDINSLAKDGRTALYDEIRNRANLDIVKHLMEKGANINSPAGNGRTVLHVAVRTKANLDVVKYLVEKGADINSLAENGVTVLHDAVYANNNLNVIKYLLERGADINSLTENGMTVLHCAVSGRTDLDLLKYLVENGADVNPVTDDGSTLYSAIFSANLQMLQYLLEKCADSNFFANDGWKVLHYAVQRRNMLDVVKFLFKKGADFNSLAKDGRTVLHAAVKVRDNFEIVKYLLEKGANINALAKDGRTVLHDAVGTLADLNVVKYLLEKGADVNSSAKDGRTVLHDAAASSADLSVVMYLLEKGANINSLDKDSRTALQVAISEAVTLYTTKYLLEKGANINSHDKDGWTVLHDAVVRRDGLDLVKNLFEKGADINALDNDGRTVLHNVFQRSNSLNLVKFLFEKGAEINSLAKDGRTVLHAAVSGRADLDEVKYLLEKGADIAALAKDGRTVLHDAVRGAAASDVVKYLAEKGTNIHSCANDGRTILHDAVGRGTNVDVVEYLLMRGININCLAKDGRTPLHDAVGRGAHFDVVKHSLDPDIRFVRIVNGIDQDFNYSKTVFPYVRDRGANLYVVKYLLEKGADIDSLADDGRTLLHDAVVGLNNFHSVPYLLKTSAGINSLNKDGRKMFHDKIRGWRNFEVVEYLLKQGANINSLARDGRTPLHDAISGLSYLKLVKYLFDVGSNITWLVDDLGTPLNDAIIWCGNLDVIKFLLKNGADSNSRDNEGFTPLHCAVDEVCGLIKYISDNTTIDIRNLDQTMIWEVVIYLQANGADANLQDIHGRTPQALATSLLANLDLSPESIPIIS